MFVIFKLCKHKLYINDQKNKVFNNNVQHPEGRCWEGNELNEFYCQILPVLK